MELVELKIDKDVALITINREKALNALNSEVLNQLERVIAQIEQTTSIRVVILTGAGSKAFVAGADISEMVKFTPIQARRFLKTGQKVLQRLSKLTPVTIAKINGFALGGGLELALACDLRFAATTAKLGLPEVTLGLIPSFGGTQRITKILGPSLAKQIVLFGEMVSAQRAKDLGIVMDIGESANLDLLVEKYVQKLLKLPPVAIDAAKISIDAASYLDLETGQELEVNLAANCFSTEDLKEGMNAFLEKRAATFKGN